MPLEEETDGVWHASLPGVRPGQLYGYRVYGQWDPRAGLRFNPRKLLVDPYARAITGSVEWHDAVYGYRQGGGPDADLVADRTDSAPYVPKGVVVEPAFSWGDDRPPLTPWEDTVIYEVHVKGFTRLHPGVPEELRGTYAGLAHEASVRRLRELGVSAVELLPVHHSVHDHFLARRGLSNYWGYQTLGYFAPDARYSSSGAMGQQVAEFKSMVRALHAAGIEVLLDVVYNHTCEGNHLGPTLAFKGLDSRMYYRLQGDARYYEDFTGTGNSLDTTQPRALQLVMDSLRYWVSEMRVDGFRFDLATTLARDPHDFDQRAAFFDVIRQDPVLSRVKLIAEPWDVGGGGYQAGRYPEGWSEWNDRYRDAVRRFWRGDRGVIRDYCSSLCGSGEVFAGTGRPPSASINYVTCHDGFTMRDLVSYNAKRNEANGDSNRDGTDHNLSWNCGAEGETDDPEVLALRARQGRNMLTTLLISQGAPMILHGDEVVRTQHGNNNAYCQDNETSWQPWELDGEAEAMLAWTRRLVALRMEHPVLRRRRWFSDLLEDGEKEICWLRPDGEEMAREQWDADDTRSFAFRLSGAPPGLRDAQGRPVRDDTLAVLVNAHDGEVEFRLPRTPGIERWDVLLDTNLPDEPAGRRRYGSREVCRVAPRSMVVLAHPTPSEPASSSIAGRSAADVAR